jgi:hypothetical protein
MHEKEDDIVSNTIDKDERQESFGPVDSQRD